MPRGAWKTAKAAAMMMTIAKAAAAARRQNKPQLGNSFFALAKTASSRQAVKGREIKSSWNNPGETLCNASGGDLAPSLDGDGAGPGTTCLLLTRKIFPHFTHVIHSLPVGFRSAFQQIVYEFPYTLRHKVVSWGSVYFFRRLSCNFLLAWLYISCLPNCQKYLWQNLGTDLMPHSA